MTDTFTTPQESGLVPRQQLQVRRRLDGPVKLVCSSMLFFAVIFSAGFVSVLTAPRYTPRTCDKSRTIFDGRSGLISDDSHPYTNGNYTQVIWPKRLQPLILSSVSFFLPNLVYLSIKWPFAPLLPLQNVWTDPSFQEYSRLFLKQNYPHSNTKLCKEREVQHHFILTLFLFAINMHFPSLWLIVNLHKIYGKFREFD